MGAVRLQRVMVYVGPSERSFYESLQDAAVPAHEALAAHAAASALLAPDPAGEAGPSSPREQLTCFTSLAHPVDTSD